MKAIILTGISAVAVTVTAVEVSALTVSPEFNSLLYPHLAELNQSQTIETLSVADGVTRLPASAYKLAGVHFLANANNKIGFNYNEQQFNQDNLNRCKKLGFSQTSCAADETPVRFCPYDERYFSQCCNNAYAYSRGECSYPRTISTNSCGGKYKCYCDTKLYPYTSCEAPKEPYDKCVDDSGTHYAECRCPANWISCDRSIHQIGNDAGCTYKGSTTYASCSCESGYNLTCDDYGPKTPTDYCFLKGTKYYKTCKTGQEVCEGLGFKNHSGSPCSADEVIDGYCPRDNNYYSCKIDPAKYCKNHGYSNAGCAKYETVSTDVCSYDSSYKKCIPTCKSRLADAGYTEVNSNLFYKGTIGAVLGDLTISGNNLLSNPLGNRYTSLRGEAAYNKYDNYSECRSDNKPKLIFKPALDVFDSDLDNVTIVIDHNNNSNEAHTYVHGNREWRDIYVTDINSGTSHDETNLGHKEWLNWIGFGSLHINIENNVKLKGDNTFTSNNYYNRLDGDNSQRTALHFFELTGKGKLIMDGGSHDFINVPILLRNNDEGAVIVLQNKATLNMPYSGISIYEGDGKFIMDNSTANLFALRVKGLSKRYKNLKIRNNSTLQLQTWLRLEGSSLRVSGRSSVRTKPSEIEVASKNTICIFKDSVLYAGNLSKTGPLTFQVGCDHCTEKKDLNSNRFKTSIDSIRDECGAEALNVDDSTDNDKY